MDKITVSILVVLAVTLAWADPYNPNMANGMMNKQDVTEAATSSVETVTTLEDVDRAGNTLMKDMVNGKPANTIYQKYGYGPPTKTGKCEDDCEGYNFCKSADSPVRAYDNLIQARVETTQDLIRLAPVIRPQQISRDKCLGTIKEYQFDIKEKETNMLKNFLRTDDFIEAQRPEVENVDIRKMTGMNGAMCKEVEAIVTAEMQEVCGGRLGDKYARMELFPEKKAVERDRYINLYYAPEESFTQVGLTTLAYVLDKPAIQQCFGILAVAPEESNDDINARQVITLATETPELESPTRHYFNKLNIIGEIVKEINGILDDDPSNCDEAKENGKKAMEAVASMYEGILVLKTSLLVPHGEIGETAAILGRELIYAALTMNGAVIPDLARLMGGAVEFTVFSEKMENGKAVLDIAAIVELKPLIQKYGIVLDRIALDMFFMEVGGAPTWGKILEVEAAEKSAAYISMCSIAEYKQMHKYEPVDYSVQCFIEDLLKG